MVMRTIPAQFFLSSGSFKAAYLDLGVAELRRRAGEALELLRSCIACPRDCHVNRLEDKWAVCKTGRHAIVSSFFPHFGEEDCLRGWNGSGTVFFSMCNLRCVFCLRPDIPVLTGKGWQRIEDLFQSAHQEVAVNGGRVRLAADVRVYTREGRLTDVTKAFCHPYRGELVVLKPYGLPPLVVTPNHAIFATSEPESRPRKLSAGSLTQSHFLVVPKVHAPNSPVELNTRALLEPHVTEFRKSARRRVPINVIAKLAAAAAARHMTTAEVSRRLGYHPAYVRRLLPRVRRGEIGPDSDVVRNELVEENGRIRFKTEKRPGIPARLPLDQRLAALLGYFCAEGHIASPRNRPNSHRLIFSYGLRERNLVRGTTTLIKDLFGVESTVMTRRTTITVEVGSTSLALFVESLCGSKSRNKRVPSVLMTAPSDVVRAFLKAYWEGDGTRQGSLIVANTVSENLALGLVALLLRLGIFPYYYATPRTPFHTVEGRRVNQSTTLYYVKCRRDAWETGRPVTTRFRHETADSFRVRIHRISRVWYEGPVYNLEVADVDHSYVASGVAVGNCQNYDISQQGQGRVATPQQLAAMMLHLQDQGCHNINFVTPEHVVPQIFEALPIAVEMGLRLPIVYNTSSYDSMHSLRLMDGVVDVYMPDFKFWDREMSRHYMKAPDYPEVARQTIREMHRQVGPLKFDEFGLAKRGVLIRHLVMPGGIAGTREIMHWIAEELGTDSYVNVMAQYYPAGQVGTNPRYDAINRRIFQDEFDEAVNAARGVGLHRLDVRIQRHPWMRWNPVTSPVLSVDGQEAATPQ